MAVKAVIKCISCVLVVLWGYSVDAINPGLQSRITGNGLNYGAQVAIDLLSSKVTSQHIPDVSGSASHLQYSLSNIKITGFTKPQSTVGLQAGKGLTWTANNLGLSLHADFKFKYKKIIPISGHGSVDVSVSGTSFSLSMAVGDDATGRPTISATGCNSNIGHLSLKFHGGSAWILKLLKGLFVDKLKNPIQKVLCSSAEDAVNKEGSKSLSKLPMTATIDHRFLLDYRLLKSPVFTQTYLDVFHKGEVFWAGAVTEAPFSAPALPTFSKNSKMIYFLASDYLMNTFAYEAHEHNFLKKNVTAKDLPADKRSYLNTTCQGLLSLCLGRLIPVVGEKYPNSQAELHMASNRPPKMTITAKDISLSFGGLIAFWARTSDNQGHFMFSVDVVLNTTLKVSAKDDKIYGEISEIALGVKLNRTEIGQINAAILQTLLNGAISIYVKPKLNELGAMGFPLPVTGQVKFTNTELSLMDDAVLLGTDFVYGKIRDEEPNYQFQVVDGTNENDRRM